MNVVKSKFLVLASIPNLTIIISKVQSIEELENCCNTLPNEKYEELQLSKEEVEIVDNLYNRLFNMQNQYTKKSKWLKVFDSFAIF